MWNEITYPFPNLGMGKVFRSTFYDVCNYLSMLGLTLIHANEIGSRTIEGIMEINHIFWWQLVNYSQKRRGLHGDSLDIHWRRWSLPSTSPVNIRVVTLTTFPFQCLVRERCGNDAEIIMYKLVIQNRIRGSHYSDVMMSTIASQITSLTIVYLTVYSGADQRKHQSSASLSFMRGIHRGPVNSLHKGPCSNAENISIWWHHHVLTLTDVAIRRH